MVDSYIERDVVIGLITSTKYLRKIRSAWDSSMLDSSMAKLLSEWCIDYFDRYGVAPYKDIRSIYEENLKRGRVRKEIGEAIETMILPSLNEEYVKTGINVDPLVHRTKNYFREQRIRTHIQDTQTQLDKGQVERAEKMALSYKPVADERSNELDLRSPELAKRLESAFSKSTESVLQYPGALGQMWNEYLIRGGLFGITASDKVGKTSMLLDMAIRGMAQGQGVAFFQAGDMTEEQQLMRFAIYLAKRSNKERYTGNLIEPVQDCMWNQLDLCDKEVRECDHGVFRSVKDDYKDYRAWKDNKNNLLDTYHKYPEYKPCHNCVEWHEKPWGVSWVKKVNVDRVLEYDEAMQIIDRFLEENRGMFKLVTYDNGSLSVPIIENRLDIWEQEEQFYPTIIIVDYAELLYSDKYTEYRHKQNDIWASLRSLSQSKDGLVIVPTQANATAYNSKLLQLDNFSEDKRKHAHVTYMCGLNRDPEGREKELGLMRVNDLVAREGWYSNKRQVTVLQNLRRGRPFIGSFWPA